MVPLTLDVLNEMNRVFVEQAQTDLVLEQCELILELFEVSQLVFFDLLDFVVHASP